MLILSIESRKTSGKISLSILTLMTITSFVYGSNNSANRQLPKTNRSSKWLPLIVAFENESCNSTDSHEIGTCFTLAQCKSASGVPKGKCASGFGVCCVIVASCSDTIKTNNTYIRSKGFPDPFKPNGYQVCTAKIRKPRGDVCQALLTFHDMELVKGDENGHCLVDNIHLFGTSDVHLPHLCGPLSKQHLYLEFGSSKHITILISTDGSQDNSVGRKWNVQVTFIGCSAPFRAPPGCLQYYTKSSGKVKLLGYPESPHLAGLKYTICVRKELGAESIFWYPCRDVPFEKSFHLQGPNFLLTNINVYWAACIGDYITIMSDDDTSTVVPNSPKDRYCGNRLTAFPPFYINSKATPYIIVVRTDLFEEDIERDNTGFCLEWFQVIWTPNKNSQGEPTPPDMLPPLGGPFKNKYNSLHYKELAVHTNRI